MGSPLLHKRQAAGHLLPPTLAAVYMPAEIPAEVDIPLPKKLKDGCGAHILHDPMENMFHWEYTSKLSTDDTPNPLKRRSKKKKSQGGLADCLKPHPVELQDVIKQGTDTCPVEEQGATMHPAAKQSMKKRPVASLPMSITGQLPRPLGKVTAIHTIHPLQLHDKCETMDPWFVEVAAIACNTPAMNRTPEQCGVFCHHHHAIRDAQPLWFSMDVNCHEWFLCYLTRKYRTRKEPED